MFQGCFAAQLVFYVSVGVCLEWVSVFQLDKAVDFEERKMLRAALRELLKSKRGKDYSFK